MKGFAPFGLSVVQSCNAVFRECTSPTELVSEIIDEIGWHEPRLKRKCEATDVGTSPPFSGVRLPSDRGVFPPTAVVFIPSRRLAGSTATSSTRDREATIHCARARVVETALTTLRAMRHGLEGSLGRSTASRPATPDTAMHRTGHTTQTHATRSRDELAHEVVGHARRWVSRGAEGSTSRTRRSRRT